MIHSLEERILLNDGNTMPGFGLGVFDANGDDCYNAVRYALDAGYRHIDTAAFYQNEEDVGKAIRESGVPREEIFLTTKLWPADYNRAQEAYEDSMRKLDCGYLDLYLMHWPGSDGTLRLKVWDMILEKIVKGDVKSAGVSNFMIVHLKDIMEKTGVVPVNNQIEFHPWNQQRELRRYCEQNNISVTAWGPLFHGHLGEEPLMPELGAHYGKSAAQVTLRWALEQGVVIIPKSARKERIIQNTEIFDFELSEEDKKAIDALDGKGSFAFDPMTYDG